MKAFCLKATLFDRVVNTIHDLWINADFPRYENVSRKAHERLAVEKHPTDALEQQVQCLIKSIEQQASIRFDPLVSVELEVVRLITIEMANTSHRLNIMERSYKDELNALYNEKQALFSEREETFTRITALKSELSDAFESKEDAYSALISAKKDVDDWYATSDRSPWLFGNSGKKLPRHSLFGQSFGDLDAYKSSRDRAYAEVQRIKDDIAEIHDSRQALFGCVATIKQRIRDLARDIQQVKDDRQFMFDMKQQGYRPHKLIKRLTELDATLAQHNARLEKIRAERAAFVISEKSAKGVVDLEAKIGLNRARRARFMDQFDQPDQQLERRNCHRHQWFESRNSG